MRDQALKKAASKDLDTLIRELFKKHLSLPTPETKEEPA